MNARMTTPAHESEVAVPALRPTDETARLGREIYERDIRHLVEADHVGEIVAVDVDSRCWAMGDGVMAARESLREIRPEAVNVLFERVGYRALRSFGAGSLRRRG